VIVGTPLEPEVLLGSDPAVVLLPSWLDTELLAVDGPVVIDAGVPELA